MQCCIAWFLFLILPVLVLVVIYIATKRYLGSGKVEQISKKYVVITGCDSGFGRLTAINLDLLGFQVIATCLTQQGKDGLKEACSQRLKAFHLDVTNSKEIQQVYSDVSRIIPKDVGLWALVNNAGIFAPGTVEWQPLDVFKRIADVNLWGMIDMTKTFLPLIKKAKGRIINMSSIAGRMSFTYMSSYSISKFGVEAFSDALRRELQPWEVEVILIEPGAFKTSICNEEKLKEMWNKQWKDLSEEEKDVYDQTYMEKAYKAFFKTFVSASDDVNMVVKTLEDAVMLKRPRARYLVGLSARVLAVISLLPSVIGDALSNAVVPTFLPSKEWQK